MKRGERLLVSSEEAPEGWALAARAAEPAVVGYVPLTYIQSVPSQTGFVEQEPSPSPAPAPSPAPSPSP